MSVVCEINSKRVGHYGCSSVSPGEKVNNTVDFRSITDVANFHFQVKYLLEVIHINGEGRAVGEVIYQGVDFAEIYSWSKKFFHCVYA